MFYLATYEAIHKKWRISQHISKFECYCHNIIVGRLLRLSCSHTLEIEEGWLNIEQETRNIELCCDMIPEKCHFGVQA